MELLQTFAEQAVIAIGSAETYRALQDRTAALAERNSEYGERIEHQSATIDVLKAMSASPGDTQPVFDLIARQAAKLCSVPTAAVATFDGTMVHLATQSGFDTAYADAYISQFPRPVGLDFSMGRAILNRRVDQVEDIAADPGHSFVDVLGHWSVMAAAAVARWRADGRYHHRPPSDRTILRQPVDLLQTFAEQAVIAISSAETYRELQERTAALAQRNSEFGERIEQQSATIDVLKAMSASMSNTQPVFDLITHRTRELCGSLASMLFEFDGEQLHLRAWGGFDPDAAQDYLRQFPMRPDRGTAVGRVILERRVVHIRDVSVDPDIGQAVRTMGVRSTAGVPLLRGGQAIGVIAIGSSAIGGFTDSQIELLRIFAEQAVIAIGSVATFKELKERT